MAREQVINYEQQLDNLKVDDDDDFEEEDDDDEEPNEKKTKIELLQKKMDHLNNLLGR